MEDPRQLLRHTLATLAYRATRAIDGAPDEFAAFTGAGRTPGEILAHMGDLLDWALSIVSGKQTWHNSAPLPWPAEKQRFFAALQAFDSYLASDEPLEAPIDRIFQGPVADALTHVGQLAMMRRLAGYKIPGENYYVAAIAVGQLAEQPEPVRTF
jgi:hypothetical protein